jgi:nucleoside diphosphate kinase
MSIEHTLAIIKPGERQNACLLDFLQRISYFGLSVNDIFKFRMTDEMVRDLYPERKNTEYEGQICKNMTNGEIYAVKISGESACEKTRVVKGKTGRFGLRLKYAKSFIDNALHASDDEMCADREIAVIECCQEKDKKC